MAITRLFRYVIKRYLSKHLSSFTGYTYNQKSLLARAVSTNGRGRVGHGHPFNFRDICRDLASKSKEITVSGAGKCIPHHGIKFIICTHATIPQTPKLDKPNLKQFMVVGIGGQ